MSRALSAVHLHKRGAPGYDDARRPGSHYILPSLRSPTAENSGAEAECIPKHLEGPRKRSCSRCPQMALASYSSKLITPTYREEHQSRRPDSARDPATTMPAVVKSAPWSERRG